MEFRISLLKTVSLIGKTGRNEKEAGMTDLYPYGIFRIEEGANRR